LKQTARTAASAVETLEVTLKFFVLPESVADGFQDGRSVGVGGNDEAVVHPLALAPGGNDSSFSQISEMPRNFWLRSADDFGEVADAYLLLCHQVDEPQASGIG
jgi:hypothetical protein